MNLIAWVRLARPLVVLLSVLGALAGALYAARGHLDVQALVPGLLGWGFLAAGTQMHNDVADYGVDFFRKRHRPLPSGAVRREGAFAASLWCYATGLGFLLFSSPAAVLTGIGLFAMAFAYNGWPRWMKHPVRDARWSADTYFPELDALNAWGKKRWFGVFLVAFGVSLIPVLGAATQGDPLAVWPLWVALFLFEAAREVVVSIQDRDEDRLGGYATLPTRLLMPLPWGVAFTLYYVSALPMLSWPYAASRAAWFVLVGLAFLTTWPCLATPSHEAFEAWQRRGLRVAILAYVVLLVIEASHASA